MFSQERISLIIDAQQRVFLSKDSGVPRESLPDVPVLNGFATIITGLRRCGKSTLLLQLMQKNFTDILFLNFEDIRLANIEQDDLVMLLAEIEKREIKTLFFDELQLIKGWEIFVNQLLREDYRVFITGSNAMLLSSDFGTHLTGRHISIELFPFSFSEFLTLKNLSANADSLYEYMFTGGVPEFAKTGQSILLTTLVDDILIKDIAVRHTVKDVDSLRKLTLFLMSNIGNPVSANKLINLFGIRASSTILEYFSYLTEAYLIDFVPQFDYSVKAQIRNPKKIYSIDTGISQNLGFNFSKNAGHFLENTVYLHLRRKYREIFYFNRNRAECDFAVMKNEKPEQLLQVAYELTPENREREIRGLTEAMDFFKTDNGVIITFDQRDAFMYGGKRIDVLPAWEFLTVK
ncbi:MAG: ATP-binding protein [Prevotellaceae bacterium]|jgi:predicted AAA+ superfamily ATPase|nr:ATP-binding protein [Prevotellaceae bacterium]